MSKCSSIDPLVTPFVDGELAPPVYEAVEAHLRACATCASRLEAERAVRALLRARHHSFESVCAPPALRAKCGALRVAGRALEGLVQAGASHRPRLASWRRQLTPLAAAAALVLVVGGLLYQATERSSRVLAAQLTADHLKCFAMNALLGTEQAPGTVERAMASVFDWQMQMPVATSQDLVLVGSRRCLYSEGQVAHIMYRHHGHPVSVFMLPREARAKEIVSALGHQCAIWSGHDRTFVLVSREARADVEQLASFAQTAFR